MSAPALTAYEPGGVTPWAGFPIVTVTGGASAAIPFELWNANGASFGDLATEVSLHLFERRAGESAWTQSRDTTLNRWAEMRATGALGAATPWTVSWTPVGQGRPFLVPPIPFNSARQLEIRTNYPGSAGTDAIELKLVVHVALAAVPLAIGSFAAGQRGILTGIGDGLESHLIRGGLIAASVVPDSNIHPDDLEWIWQGVPQIRLGAALALNGTSASGALVAGQEYIATLSGGGSGLTVTKSPAGTAPLGPGDRPAVPNGELLLSWVRRPFSGVITGSEITNAQTYGRFALGGTGLTRTLGPGSALVDDRLVRWDTLRLLSLPASTSGVGLWLLPNGTPAASVARPDLRALLLYRADTDGSGITALVDLRTYIDTRRGVLAFRFDAALAPGNASRIRTFPGDADGALSVGRSCVAILDDLGTTATAGSTVFDVQVRTGASTWVSLFTSSGTIDRRPTLAFNAAYPYQAEGKPEVVAIWKGAELRAVVIAVPTAVAAPSGAEVQLFFEVP